MEAKIILNGSHFTITEFCEQSLDQTSLWALSAQDFLKEWKNGDNEFSIKTSGSTGKPKEIKVNRSQFIASAKATISALNLQPKLDALVCISTQKIGGLMMLVRGLIGGWNMHLVEPSTNLVKSLIDSHFEFGAMVPIQVESLIKNGNQNLLEKIDKIIIGGAPIDKDLGLQIAQLKNKVYHTYGMTETVSHIALKNLTAKSKSTYYEVIGDNQLEVDSENRLRVKGSVTKNEWIQTNDIVELDGPQFKWLGRSDLTINSGGVKVNIEELEKLFDNHLPKKYKGKVWVWKKPDLSLGEMVVAITDSQEIINLLTSAMAKQFPKYHWPKEFYKAKKLVYTESGKKDRIRTFQGSSPVE